MPQETRGPPVLLLIDPIWLVSLVKAPVTRQQYSDSNESGGGPGRLWGAGCMYARMLVATWLLSAATPVVAQNISSGATSVAAAVSPAAVSGGTSAPTSDVEGVAGGGLVKIRASANGWILSVSIADALLQPGEKQKIEALVTAALNDARAKSDALSPPKNRAMVAAAGAAAIAVTTTAASVPASPAPVPPPSAAIALAAPAASIPSAAPGFIAASVSTVGSVVADTPVPAAPSIGTAASGATPSPAGYAPPPAAAPPTGGSTTIKQSAAHLVASHNAESFVPVAPAAVFPDPEKVRALLNALRTNPGAYADELTLFRTRFDPANPLNYSLPGDAAIHVTVEGVAAVDEAIDALRKQAALGAVAHSPLISLAAGDHVSAQGPTGEIGHTDPISANVGERMTLRGGDRFVSEAISYGAETAEDVIRQLIVDDGITGRGHRVLLLSGLYHFVGIACGPHIRWRLMCVLDLSGAENGGVPLPKSTK